MIGCSTVEVAVEVAVEAGQVTVRWEGGAVGLAGEVQKEVLLLTRDCSAGAEVAAARLPLRYRDRLSRGMERTCPLAGV